MSNLNQFNELISDEKAHLRKQILDYSINVKNYAKWFEIADVNKNEDSFTTYKVIYRFLPKDLNESIKEVIVWKRFRDFKDLNHILSEYHMSLHRKDKFPEFVKSKFFGRFDDKIIEERKEHCLRLLQFIGSQSHLYRHDMFIEFLLEGKLNDHVENIKKTLDPIVINEDNKNFTDTIKQFASDLNQLLNSKDLKENKNYEEISLFLTKSLRYINSALANETDKNHFASYKLLKSAANTLDNFISDIDNHLLDEKRKLLIKDLINKLNKCSNEIESTSLRLEPDETLTNTVKLSRNESTILNDWVLSEFNLLSNDFNSDLAFISGNLFDLNFNYKTSKVLNQKCFLMKLRNIDSTDTFLLKRLQKSSNPNLTIKCQVPLNNQVPFMCKLIKYYETDYTIFLLVDYHPLGKLFQYLDLLLQYGDLFIEHLPTKLTDSFLSDTNSLRRRKSSSISSFKSVSCLTSLDKSPRKAINRTQSLKDNSPVKSDLKQVSSLTKLTEVHLENIKFIDEFDNAINENITSPSLSSDSSSDSNSKKEIAKKELFSATNFFSNSLKLFKINSESSSKLSKLNSLTSSTTKKLKTKIFFNNQPESDISLENSVKLLSLSVSTANTPVVNDPYLKQVQLWLAQLVLAIKNLHRLFIIGKDLRPDNLMLAKNGQLILTYTSKWDLVDEILNKDAINHFYSAPELCGLVNFSISEKCDYWTFGVIAYELLTMNKYSDLNSDVQIYGDNIIFPDSFKNETAKDLIKKLLCLNPDKRINFDQVQNHLFFKQINWNDLEHQT